VNHSESAIQSVSGHKNIASRPMAMPIHSHLRLPG
jgi:hypothetical protein